MADYSRIKEGFRFQFNGMKVNASPDSLSQGKYALAINVRGYSEHSIRTRPGTTQLFSGGFLDSYFTDIRAYAALQTDDLPRILGRTANDSVYLDNGNKVGTLAGFGGTAGAAMIPFRPNASPNPYMYIANGKDYQKFSAPDATNAVRKFQVGMPEPQQAPDAAVTLVNQASLITPAPSFTPGGTASALATGTRVTDLVGTVFADPGGGDFTFQVAPAPKYQQRMMLIIAGNPNNLVRDVIPPLLSSYPVTGIFYFAGTTGRCIVVSAALSPDSGPDESIYKESLITTLRRGSIIKIGTELCFVWSVTSGPDGSAAIETSTIATHTVGERITGVPALRVTQLGGGVPITGQAISEPTVTFSVAAGIGTQTRSSLGASPFALMQPDDYISFGLKVDNLANLSEMKILFDVSDGTFTKDFYYLTVRPSDIQAGIANSATQLATAQTAAQRALIDEERGLIPPPPPAPLTRNPGEPFFGFLARVAAPAPPPASSLQLEAGSNVWSQIVFSLRDLTRVGSDNTKNLQTVTAMQLLFNASGTINVEFDQAIAFFGGSQPDVGDAGAPYLYRVRPRSTITGVKGNPSPPTRYGVNPRRETISVITPNIPVSDFQMDTLDVFRYGGTVLSWRWVGAIQYFGGARTGFIDNFSDDAVGAGEELEFDNLEPWPSVGLPNVGSASLTGTVAIINTTDPSVPFYLPGTLIEFQVGVPDTTAFTLRTRPTNIGGNNYLFELVENAGASSSLVTYAIQEPLVARQKLPYMWGPDVNGTIFAVGDPLNPGKVYFTKNNSPDAAPAPYNIEISPPSEPLLGGEVLDGLSFVGSTERWWALYPTPDNPAQRYNFVQQPIPRGLAAPYGHCTDGVSIFWWAKDGIYSSTKGSLTDEDLYNLFPHEGAQGSPVTYNGVTVQTPDYSQAAKFRLVFSNGFLYALYPYTLGGGTFASPLVLDLKKMAWSVDTYPTQITSAYKVEQQVASGPPNSAALNPVLLLGGTISPALTQGVVLRQTDLTNDGITPITCVLATNEFDGGDIRAGEQWGDVFLDSLPAAKGVALKVTPMNLGVPAAAQQTIAQSSVRVQQPVSLGGAITSNFLGLFLQWSDDFANQAVPTTLYIWQPSFIPKPELIGDRVEDWEDAGVEGAKWIQGFVLHADTTNVIKGMTVRDSDTLAVHAFTPPVQHNGESEKAYSFNQPFIAHQVRLEPTDALPWRLFGVRWIAEPTPEFAETWTTQPSTHGLKGFMHLRQASITYASTVPVTMTVGVFDGIAPAAIVLPSTGGVVQKLVVPFTPNKGQLYTYSFSGAVPFQIYQDKCEVLVGQWGREDSYINRPLVGGQGGDEAKV